MGVVLPGGLGQFFDGRAVEADTIEVGVVNALGVAAGNEVQPADRLIGCNDPFDRKLSPREPTHQLAFEIVEIEVVPTVAQRLPDELPALGQQGEETLGFRVVPEVAVIGLFGEESNGATIRRVHGVQIDLPIEVLNPKIVEVSGVGVPAQEVDLFDLLSEGDLPAEAALSVEDRDLDRRWMLSDPGVPGDGLAWLKVVSDWDARLQTEVLATHQESGGVGRPHGRGRGPVVEAPGEMLLPVVGQLPTLTTALAKPKLVVFAGDRPSRVRREESVGLRLVWIGVEWRLEGLDHVSRRVDAEVDLPVVLHGREPEAVPIFEPVRFDGATLDEGGHLSEGV